MEERESKSKSSNQAMIQFLKFFVSILVSVPGHPSHGPFYLLEALLKVVKAWDWYFFLFLHLSCYSDYHILHKLKSSHSTFILKDIPHNIALPLLFSFILSMIIVFYSLP